MADFTFAHRKEGFDDHIDKSIRGYSNLLDDIIGLSRYFVEDNTNIVDIGCSTGKLTKSLIEFNQDHCDGKYIGIEVADGFVKDIEKRKKELISHNTEFIIDDIRNYKFENCSFVTSVFTLQFMSKKDRTDIVKNIYKGLNSGGAFIFAEKTICSSALVQDMITFNHYDYKKQYFDEKDIMDKERTLRHMMKPNTWKEIEKMIKSSGFKEVQPFWRNHAFVGAIAIK